MSLRQDSFWQGLVCVIFLALLPSQLSVSPFEEPQEDRVIASLSAPVGEEYAVPVESQTEDRIEASVSSLDRPQSHLRPKTIVFTRPKKGRVVFQVPNDVRVYWNGKPVDPKRGLSAEREGMHSLRIERDGQDPLSKLIQVRGERPTVVRIPN